MNKKKKIIVILSIALVIFVIITILGIIINKGKNKYIRFNEFDISECINKECNKTFKFNKNTLNITNDKYNNYIIKINDVEKIIGSNGYPELGKTIYTFDDSVLIEQTLSEFNKDLSIISISGNDMIISRLTDENYIVPTGFEYKDILDEKGTAKGKEIIMTGSNFIDENTFLFASSPNAMVILNDCETYEKNKDKVVSGVYRIKYLDNKFSEIEVVSETKLKDYKEKDFSKLCENK